MPPVLQGRHTVIAAETGSGKTFAYLAPLFTRLLALPQPPPTPVAVVLCPNMLLADQVAAAANSLRDASGAPLMRTVALSPSVVRCHVSLVGYARVMSAACAAPLADA